MYLWADYQASKNRAKEECFISSLPAQKNRAKGYVLMGCLPSTEKSLEITAKL